MKKFIIKIFLLGIPFYIYILFIILIDPYNYFGISSLADDSLKARTTYMINPVLGNMMSYKYRALPNITISDSRFAHKDLNSIRINTGIEFAELYAHDGLIQEFMSFFRYADRLVKLERVYICINFSAFTDTKRINLVESAESIADNPVLYIFNRNIAEASFICFMNTINPAGEKDLSKPVMDRKAFWYELLNTTELRFYRNYTYPEKYIANLKDISIYCRQKNIRLSFIIPPTNSDMQSLIVKNNLNSYKERFIKDLSDISIVYDMDFLNSLTEDSAAYLDPNHLYKEKLTSLFEYIINNKPDSLAKYVRIYGKEN